MTVEQLSKFHLGILDSLKEIQIQTLAIKKDLLNASEAKTNLIQDGLGHASDESDLTTQLEIHSHTLERRNQLQAAIQRIADGTFGVCVNCEEEIDPRRLQAHPIAQLCIGCQETLEREANPKLFVHANSISFETFNLVLVTS